MDDVVARRTSADDGVGSEVTDSGETEERVERRTRRDWVLMLAMPMDGRGVSGVVATRRPTRVFAAGVFGDASAVTRRARRDGVLSAEAALSGAGSARRDRRVGVRSFDGVVAGARAAKRARPVVGGERLCAIGISGRGWRREGGLRVLWRADCGGEWWSGFECCGTAAMQRNSRKEWS